MKKFILYLFIILIAQMSPTKAQTITETRDIFFPTNKEFHFEDTFGADRYQHFHEGTDIIGEQMAPLYAAVDGVISFITIPEASWGYHLAIRDSDGYTYHYLHINNDTPGTDDGNGGTENAFAPGIKKGSQVSRGQLVAYMGDSGNAESVGHHLHFEIRKPDDTPINAFESLRIAQEKNESQANKFILKNHTINKEKNLKASTLNLCQSGSLIKMADYSAVYYCGADSKRYVFPNENIFYSWYDSFDSAKIIEVEKMEAIPLGGNVTYNPGKRMIKLQSSSKVYLVETTATLRWVQSAEFASSLYGPDWNQYIDDIPDSWFMDYRLGETLITI